MRGGGPKTVKGKRRSSQNAIKFGLFAKRTVLESENLEEFEAFRSWLLADLRPMSAMQTCLAEDIVSHYWRLQRVREAEKFVIDRQAVGMTGAKLGAGYAMIRDAQEDKILPTIGAAEDRLHGRLRRLVKDYYQMQEADANTIDV